MASFDHTTAGGPDADESRAVDYVLGALSPTDAEAFEDQLADDAELKRRVQELRSTYESLGESVAASPPVGLREQVLDAAYPASSSEPVVEFDDARSKVIPLVRPKNPVPTAARWALAAACLLAVSLGYDDYRLRQTLDLERAVTALLHEPNLVRSFTLGGDSGTALVSLDLDAERGAIVAKSLPRLATGETYRLWARVGSRSVHCVDFRPTGEEARVVFAVPVDSYQGKVDELIISRESGEVGETVGGPVVLRSRV